jgi:hypothetical protein
MKKYLITGILCIAATFVYAQTEGEVCPDVVAVTEEIQEETDNLISKSTTESKITNRHYVSRLDNISVDEFTTFAEARKEFGHKAGGSFDNWKKRNGKNAKFYMFYTNAEGKVHLYHEALDEEMAEQFRQHLPKGVCIFDENTYNMYFRGIDFSKNHWKEGSDVHARLADMRRLAVAVGKDLGITVNPDKITFRLFETQRIEGLPPARIYIPTTTKRDDGIGGFAKWDDAVTSIEIDADKLKTGSISDAIRTMVEEVYHKYQMAEVKKLQTEKARIWDKSFHDNNRNDYGGEINDLQKQINAEKNTKKREDLQKQQAAAIHSYFNLPHEQDAKEFAGGVAAMEYAIRKNLIK